MNLHFKILTGLFLVLTAILFSFSINDIQYPVNPEFITSISDNILGDSTSSNKRIEIDLTNQLLNAYNNDQLIYQYKISSGTYNRTPNGIFYIWAKIRSQKMSGGSKESGNYYYLPNVPYILFFYNDQTPKKSGFSIHGTYWHNNFGVPMSHGCINMRTSEAALIYNWADQNTPIIIYGHYTGKITSR